MSLPDYVVEPPDILLIEVTVGLRPPEAPLRAGELLELRVAGPPPADPRTSNHPRTGNHPDAGNGVQRFLLIEGLFRIQPNGMLNLGPDHGTVPVRGLSLSAARRLVELHLKQTLPDPHVELRAVTNDPRQRISGERLVRPDGTITLGGAGSVYVAGLSLSEAQRAIERHLAGHLYAPRVSLDVAASRSKVYYVVIDGGGSGEQVFRFPITGNETVLDALSQINGLPEVASRKHIWIARPAPADSGCQQVLDVDWNGIVQGAQTATNYQILPGDRIYVRADDLVTFSAAAARATAPLRRILGVARPQRPARVLQPLSAQPRRQHRTVPARPLNPASPRMGTS